MRLPEQRDVPNHLGLYVRQLQRNQMQRSAQWSALPATAVYAASPVSRGLQPQSLWRVPTAAAS